MQTQSDTGSKALGVNGADGRAGPSKGGQAVQPRRIRPIVPTIFRTPD